MKKNKVHLGYRIWAFALVLCLILPIGVKITHLFQDHDHDVCVVQNQTHFHEVDLDCEFYKFKINHNSLFEFFNFELKPITEVETSIITYYSFIKSHKQLSSSLRGPPVLA